MRTTITVMDYSDSSINIYTDVDINEDRQTEDVENFIHEHGHSMSECYYMTSSSVNFAIDGVLISEIK